MIPGLTGLRGVAAVWVVLFHLTLGLNVPIIRYGDLGVDVFFILSGFILMHVYAKTLRVTDTGDYVRFLRARIARIYPLHVFMLFVVMLAVLALPGFATHYSDPERRFGISSFIASLLLIQNWAYWPPGSWNLPSWSLSAEWFAYLTFPVFLTLTQRWRSVTMPLLLAAGSLVLYWLVLVLKGVHEPGKMGELGMVRLVLEFPCGALLFRAMANGLPPLPRSVDALAVALLLVATLDSRTLPLALPAFALTVLLAAQNMGWVARALSAAPVLFLGEISYSIYMVHWILLQVANWMMAAVHLSPVQLALWDTVQLAAILGCSMLTYHLIERPARAWGRGVATRRARPLAGVDPA